MQSVRTSRHHSFCLRDDLDHSLVDDATRPLASMAFDKSLAKTILPMSALELGTLRGNTLRIRALNMVITLHLMAVDLKQQLVREIVPSCNIHSEPALSLYRSTTKIFSENLQDVTELFLCILRVVYAFISTLLA